MKVRTDGGPSHEELKSFLGMRGHSQLVLIRIMSASKTGIREQQKTEKENVTFRAMPDGSGGLN